MGSRNYQGACPGRGTQPACGAAPAAACCDGRVRRKPGWRSGRWVPWPQTEPGADAFPLPRPCRSGVVAQGNDSVRSGSWLWFLELDSLLDQVAILSQFADKRIDLPQAQRSLRAAFQIAAHESVLAHAQFQCRGAGLIASHTAVFLGQREHAQDAANSRLGLTMVDRVADGADVGACFTSARQQLMRVLWRALRAVLIADAMTTTLLPQMFAQQLAAARIEQPHIHRVPLHVDLAADPARRRTIVSSIHLHAAIHMNGALAILVVTERLQWQRLQVRLLFGEHRCYLPRSGRGCACRPNTVPSGPDTPAPLPGSRTSCPSAAFFAHGLRYFRLFLFDPDPAPCTAVPLHRNAPEHRDTRDSNQDRRCQPTTRLHANCPEPRPVLNHPAGEKPFHATRPTHAHWIGSSADEHTCDCNPVSLQTAACADTCHYPDRAPSAPCRNQPELLRPAASR